MAELFERGCIKCQRPFLVSSLLKKICDSPKCRKRRYRKPQLESYYYLYNQSLYFQDPIYQYWRLQHDEYLHMKRKITKQVQKKKFNSNNIIWQEFKSQETTFTT